MLISCIRQTKSESKYLLSPNLLDNKFVERYILYFPVNSVERRKNNCVVLLFLNTQYTVGENIIGAPKKRNDYNAIHLFFNIAIEVLNFSLCISPHLVITL